MVIGWLITLVVNKISSKNGERKTDVLVLDNRCKVYYGLRTFHLFSSVIGFKKKTFRFSISSGRNFHVLY